MVFKQVKLIHLEKYLSNYYRIPKRSRGIIYINIDSGMTYEPYRSAR